MADASYAQTSFLGGEISKYSQGRFELPTYRTSMNVCLNAFPVEQGAWTRRPGTQFCGSTRNGQQGRLIAFDIKQSSPYNIEFTAGFLRFWNATVLATTNDDKAVSGISTANPALVTTGVVHGWVTGNSVQFANLGATCPLLQNRIIITKVGNSTFTLVDSITGATIDGSTLGVGSLAAGATVQRILEVASPWTGTLWQNVRLIQTEQAALILHPTIPPQVLVATLPAAGQTFFSFTLVPAVLNDGPYLDPPTNGALLSPLGTSGNTTLTLVAQAWDTTVSYAKGAFVSDVSINYQSLVDQNEGNTPGSSPTQWTPASAGLMIGPNGFVGTDIGRLIRIQDFAGNWTWGKITGLVNLISPGTGSNIGNMTGNGGLAAAFNNTLLQSSISCATFPAANTDPTDGYVGKNYSAAPQKIDHAVLYPSTDFDIYSASYTFTQTETTWQLQGTANLTWSSTKPQSWSNGSTVTGSSSGATGIITSVSGGSTSGTLTLNTVTANFQVGEAITSGISGGTVTSFTPTSFVFVQIAQSSTVITTATSVTEVFVFLRAKQTSPVAANDGTILGATVSEGGPVVVPSSFPTTAWNFVWLHVSAIQINDQLPANIDQRNTVPLFFGSIAFQFTYALNSFAIQEFVSQAQFFSPSGAGAGNTVDFQILGNPLADTTLRPNWRLGAYSNTTGWPTCGTYHEGRIWIAGAIGNRLDGSVSNGALPVVNTVPSVTIDFQPTLTTGQVVDSNAITAVFNASDVNTIFWMVPDALGLICGTQAGDWLVQATANNIPLTPLSIQAHRFSKMGCANIEPRRADHVLILVQRFRRKLFEYFADVFSGKFQAQNLTANTRHLTRPGIAEIAYQQELTPVIWARCDDGSWFGLTYKRESNVSANPPTFEGGHRHALGSGRLVESIVVGPSTDGTLDSLAMVTNDPTTNIRHVEMLTKLFEEGSAETTAWFLDDAINPPSTTSSTVAAAGQPYGALTINGLWHANGRTVTVFCGGIDCGDFQVSNGSIVVPYGDGLSAGTGNGLFIPALAAAGPIVVGFTYTSQGQIVRPATPQESGARSGPALGKKRRNMQFAALLDNTAGISFGTTFNGGLYPALFQQPNGTNFTTGQMFSGVYWNTLKDDYSFDGMICWQITRPYSATVCAIEGFIQTMDK